MGKSDEPTRIQVNRGAGGAKKKTVNKTTRPVTKREAEKISDAADALVMDDVKPAKKAAKSTAKAPVKAASRSAKTGVKAGTKSLMMDGMVRQKSPAKAKPVNTKGDLDAKADKLKLDETKLIEDEEIEVGSKTKGEKTVGEKAKKQFSKSKATMIAIATAILVGAIGMVLMFFLNRQSEKMCVLQFESNGGTQIEEQTVVCGTNATRPDDPEKEGFEFQDWLLEGMPFDFEGDTVDRDMVVIAKWLVDADAEIVKITFDSAGGSEVTEREALKGARTTPPLDPTRDGYTFEGWYLDGEKFDFDTPIEEDITLVAGWRSSDGTLTIQQKGETTDKKTALDILSVQQGIVMEVGDTGPYRIGVNPVSAEVDLDISSSNPSVVNCTKDGDGRSMSCAASSAGTAEVTVRDKISGKTAKTTITVKAKDSGSSYVPSGGNTSGGSTSGGNTSGGTSGGSTTTPTTPTEPEPETPEPTEEEKCTAGGGTWNGTACVTTGQGTGETGISLIEE